MPDLNMLLASLKEIETTVKSDSLALKKNNCIETLDLGQKNSKKKQKQHHLILMW